jgi:hypothetical protein
MDTKKSITISVLALILCLYVNAQENPAPYGLNVNLLTAPEKVLLNGYPVFTPLDEAVTHRERFQFTEVSSFKPFFGWIVPSEENNTRQTAYRIEVASDKEMLLNDSADFWDSGKVQSSQSTNISYNGKQLTPGSVFFWRVKLWKNRGEESAYSEILQFKSADTLMDYATDRYPIQKKDDYPLIINPVGNNRYFADYGKAAFGRLRLNLYSENGTDSVTIHLGEAEKNGSVDPDPGASIRYSRMRIKPEKGWHTYILTIPPNQRNTASQAVLMPDYIGEVTPFRYCEIEDYPYPLQEKDMIRESVFYPFDEYDSRFHSADTLLNSVWDLSKYSIKATSFAGVYIDGDRERIPYEADALINQLSHYCVARDYNMARYTHEYLIHRPTWPTEWIMQSVLMAWEDYMYTGNISSLVQFYDDLKAKTLTALSDEQGFISTRTAKVTPELLRSIHFNGQLRDIVDWPHTGILGLEKEEGGEADGFIFTDINTVVNAYHYRAIVLMAEIAKAVGKEEDQQFYSERAARLKRSFNNALFDKKRGVYRDGIGTDHASLHANMFPLAFGLVEERNVASVLAFIRSRKMACSVYGAQFLLDALYDHHDAAYGLELLTSTSDRSWYNMILTGSTITTEAWDNKYKPNQDWNHAWGAAPANLIPRKLMGIIPLEPGFRKIRIKPQPATLESAEIMHPTIRGDVMVRFVNNPGQSFLLEVTIPGNTSAEVHLPFYSKKQKVLLDNQPIAYRRDGDFSVIDNIGSGNRVFTVER